MIKKITLLICLFLLIPSIGHGGTTATSGVTAQSIINDVRKDLNEVTPVKWSDRELLQWMNEAVWEINSLTRCLESAATSIVLVQDDYDYDINGSYLDIEMVLYDSGVTTEDTQIYTLDRVNIKDIGHERERGNPKKYCIWNDDIIVWPIPRSDQAGNSIYLYKISLPSGITTSTSSIETPAYFDLAILNYIKAKALLKYNQDALGLKFMEIFDRAIENYPSSVIRRNVTEETN